MSRSTTSLHFPDVNLWFAILLADHVHRAPARTWWDHTEGMIAFTRFTEMAVLRLLTTSAAMNGKPLAMDAAWRAYDRLFEDDRVVFLPEPEGVESHFRKLARGRAASPKLWADAWLVAIAKAAGGVVVTFDRALARREGCLLLEAPGYGS